MSSASTIINDLYLGAARNIEPLPRHKNIFRSCVLAEAREMVGPLLSVKQIYEMIDAQSVILPRKLVVI